MSEKLHVELKPHIGVVGTDVGSREIRLPQSIVFVNGVYAGYVGDKPGSHISIILTNVLPEDLAEIKRQVDALRESESSKISQARTVEQSTADGKAATTTTSLKDVEV